MLKTILILVLLCISSVLFAQKPILDTTALFNWPTISDRAMAISSDGKYVSYTIEMPGRRELLYLQSTEGKLKRKMGYGNGHFTEDGKRFICQAPGDSLCIFDLKMQTSVYREGVQTYRVPERGNGHWMAYKTVDGDWKLEDLFSGRTKSLMQAQDIMFSHEGKKLVLKGFDNLGHSWLKLLDLANGAEFTICRQARASNLLFDQAEDALAFISSPGAYGQAKSVVRLYRLGMDSAAVVVNEHTLGVEQGFQVKEDGLTFSSDGKKLFFTLHRCERIPGANTLGASVDVWNYKDEYSQGMQLENPSLDHLLDFKAVLNIGNGKVLRLEEETDEGNNFAIINEGGNGNLLLTTTKWNIGEQEWRPGERPSLYLVNTDDAHRKQIAPKGNYDNMQFSPAGKYVVWFDRDKRAYFSYNLQKGICKVVSTGISFSLTNEENDFPIAKNAIIYGSPGWLTNDSKMFVYDRYDIWALDPDGRKAPVNLTNGFGRRNKIVLRCAYAIEKFWPGKILLKPSGDLLLSATDEKTKNNGFFKLNVYRSGDPEKLTMSPAMLYMADVAYSAFFDFPQTMYKAGNTERYLLTKSSVIDYPNLVITSDFKHFKELTNLEPQIHYNWMTSVLLRWTTFGGHLAEGILYKPENFDPKKKYPVIFTYYERKGNGINTFYPAEFSHGEINIPWFVSRGYLVFCPDIHYIPGDPGAGIYDYVISGAALLRKKAWVDGNHMGLNGRSFAGFETDYLIAHTHLFAAAASVAGYSDLFTAAKISPFWPNGNERYLEYAQLRMKYPYWERPDLYMRNSAVFKMSQIATPLLLVANKEDGSVPWEQGEELFMGLRRLGKPVWMLQYDHEGHALDGRSAVDYTLRMTQFFDHYLKGSPEPKWMRESIPLRNKGLENYLEY